MSRSSSKFQSDSFLTQESSRHLEEKDLWEGSFSSTRNNQKFIERLKKNNLHKTYDQLKTPQLEDNDVGDPFINWLRQNSHNRNYSRNSEVIYYKRNLLDDEEFNRKQKKTLKKTLPKIRSFAPAQSPLILSKYQRRKSKRPFKTEIRSPLFAKSQFSKQARLKNNFSSLDKTHLLRLSSNQSPQHHKNQCYNHSLSKTQFQKKDSSLFPNEKKLNKIKSNFYLNEHKKVMSTESFYMKHSFHLQKDFDLKRIKGLPNYSVQPFEKNLQKLEKKSSLTCYNQLSEQFGSMKKQIQKLILQNYQNAPKKTLWKRESNYDMNKTTIERQKVIKLNQQVEKSEEKSEKESFLPKFLMKSLNLHPQSSKSQTSFCKMIPNLRI